MPNKQCSLVKAIIISIMSIPASLILASAIKEIVHHTGGIIGIM